jgi:cell division protein FtsL
MSGKINAVLLALLIACALSLVKAQYQARHLFIEVERAKSEARQLDTDYAQLQLDQSTYGKNVRIEQIARTDLGMQPVSAARTQYLTAEVAK